jgi:hypothetical protein
MSNVLKNDSPNCETENDKQEHLDWVTYCTGTPEVLSVTGNWKSKRRWEIGYCGNVTCCGTGVLSGGDLWTVLW